MSKENGVSKILSRVGTSYKWRSGKDESALHAEHKVFPHDHVVTGVCSGRFWCTTCKGWFSAAECEK